MEASQDSFKWRTVMKKVISLDVSRNARITFSSWETISFLRITLLYGAVSCILVSSKFLYNFHISWTKYIKFSSCTSLFYNFCRGAVSSLYCGRLAGLSGSFERTPPRTLDLWHPSSLLMQMAFTVGANYFTELLQIKSRCLSQWMDGTGLWERR
jgi:hypothetical protein